MWVMGEVVCGGCGYSCYANVLEEWVSAWFVLHDVYRNIKDMIASVFLPKGGTGVPPSSLSLSNILFDVVIGMH